MINLLVHLTWIKNILLSQAFINQSFENITSIEHSLKLLHKFQSILQRESLKSDLDSKLNIIFQVGAPWCRAVVHLSRMRAGKFRIGR